MYNKSGMTIKMYMYAPFSEFEVKIRMSTASSGRKCIWNNSFKLNIFCGHLFTMIEFWGQCYLYVIANTDKWSCCM